MKHLRAIVKSPKTSIPGIALILAAIGAVISHPAALLHAESSTPIITSLISGLGLLLAADSGAEPPKS